MRTQALKYSRRALCARGRIWKCDPTGMNAVRKRAANRAERHEGRVVAQEYLNDVAPNAKATSP